MSEVNDKDFLFGAPIKEEDEPLDPSQMEQIDPLTRKKLEIADNDKKRKDKKWNGC